MIIPYNLVMEANYKNYSTKNKFVIILPQKGWLWEARPLGWAGRRVGSGEPREAAAKDGIRKT